MFFHASEVTPLGGGPAPPRGVNLATVVPTGADVSFCVGAPSGRAGKQVAVRVTVLPPGSRCPFTVDETRIVGVVDRELRGGDRGGWGRSAPPAPGAPPPTDTGYGGRILHRPENGPPVTYSFDGSDLADAGAPRPRVGEGVEFCVATDKATGAVHTTRVSRLRERGVIAAVKRTDRGVYGFVRCLDRPGQVFFHGSSVTGGAGAALAPGAEATFAVALDDGGGRPAAVALELLPPNTLPETVDVPGVLAGRVVPLANGGLAISYPEADGRDRRVAWKGELKKKKKKEVIAEEVEGETAEAEDEEAASDDDGGGNDDAAPPADQAPSAPAITTTPDNEPTDPDAAAPYNDVFFELCIVTATGERRAHRVAIVTRAADRRELGAVASLKSGHGLIKCCDRPGDILFRFEDVVLGDGVEEEKAAGAAADAADSTTATTTTSPPPFAINDDVEFSIARDATGRTIAVRVTRAPPGAAVFETVDDTPRCGWVVDRLQKKGPKTTLATGVVEYVARDGDPAPAAARRPGVRARLTFGAADLDDAAVNPRVGDCVVFHIATDPRIVTAAKKAGSSAAAFAGRRATRVRPVVLDGTIIVAKPTFGFVEYDLQAAIDATGGELVLVLSGKGGDGDGDDDDARGDAAAVDQQPPAAEWAAKLADKAMAAAVAAAGVAPAPAAAPPADAPAAPPTPAPGGEAAAAADDTENPTPAPSTTTKKPPPTTKSRLYFNASETNGTDVRRGDGVTFTLAERAATREPVAHRLVRVKDAPSRSRGELIAEKRPDGMNVFTGGAAGAASRGNLGVRQATRPDGGRGFTVATSPGGRGRLLAQIAAAAAASRVPGQGGAEEEGGGVLNPGAAEFVP